MTKKTRHEPDWRRVMRTIRACRAAAVLLLISSGCATAGAGTESREVVDRINVAHGNIQVVSPASKSSDLVDASVDRVWVTLLMVYEELGIPLEVHEPANKRLGNSGFRPGNLGGERLSRYLDCGRGMGISNYADSYQVSMSITTHVSENDDGRALVETEVVAYAEPRAVRGDPLHCSTLGTLERRIVDMVSERVHPSR
jgi:hypothetical protein